MVTTGSVDATTLRVTLSAEVELLPDHVSSHDFTLVGMTASTYLMVYHNSTIFVDEYYGYGALQAKVATVNTNTGTITVGAEATLLGSAAIFDLAATRLSDRTAVVAYADYASNYAMVTQVVNIGDMASASSVGE